MALTHLSEHERQVVHECLRASLQGPFFPEWEFHSLFGIARSELAGIVAAWPDVDERTSEANAAINNSLINLLGYPHGCEGVWSDFISVSAQEVDRIYAKWAGTGHRGLW